MVSTSQKMCCLLARISSVFSNCVPLGGGFHQRKSSSGQKTLFRLDRKSVSTSLIWDFLENTFYYTEKLLSLQKISEKIEKIDFHQQEYGWPLKIDFPKNFNKFPLAEKNWNKQILSPADEKLVSTCRNKGLAEKYVPVVKEKQLSLAAVDCCLRKWKKVVSTSQLASISYGLSLKIGFQ